MIGKWIVHCYGEKEAGLPSVSAEVILPMPRNTPNDEIEFIRETLEDAFADIWGTSLENVACWTDEEERLDEAHDCEVDDDNG